MFLSPVICIFVFYLHELRSGANGRTLQGTITDNTSWFVAPLHQRPVLFFEMRFTVEFPVETCCPIMDIYYTPKDYEKFKCYTDLAKSERVWYRNNIFFLEYLEGSLVECVLKVDNSSYQCTRHFKLQDYEPKMRWFTFGYLCSNNGTTSLKGLQYNLTIIKESNVTTCENIDLDSSVPVSAKCSKFYSTVSFPNLFGDHNQIEASRSLDTFYARLDALDPPCHPDLELILCQVFFPQCGMDSSFNWNKSRNRHDLQITTTHLVHPCKELCEELIQKACVETFGKTFSHGATCSYFPSQNTSQLCIYNPLTCETPTAIQHGTYHPVTYIYPAESVVHFSCAEGFILEGPINSTCEYSGLWTPQPWCKPEAAKEHMKTYIALGVSAGVLFGVLLALMLAYVLKRRYFQPLHIPNINYRNDVLKSCAKRNRPFDSFVSYFSEGSDSQFVRQYLHKKLEEEHIPPFKLLNHIRDFRADTLIYVNILNAIKESNCAIIVLSQEYIDSRWCREEFEECMEENANDPSFRLFVILMQPLEKLERLTAYMNKYLRSKTFLQRTDPKLAQKLTQYLKELQINSTQKTKMTNC